MRVFWESYRRYLEGDDEGMVEVIRDHKDGLTLYLAGIVGNIFTAEELTEETFFKLVVKKPRFAGKSSFKTWLYAIGRTRSAGRALRFLLPYKSIYDIIKFEAGPPGNGGGPENQQKTALDRSRGRRP